MTEYYKAKLEQGLEYQDFITEIMLREFGIVISTFSSRKYQTLRGETIQGIEIKFDRKYQSTGNLYIETHEKTNEANRKWIESGIYRGDNTWLYLIGDYHDLFIFSKKFLVLMYESFSSWERWGMRSAECGDPKTSKGFLLPRNTAMKYCIKHIEPAPYDQSEL